jgi:hypothetical protein
VAVPGAPGQAARGIELPVRGAQPAQADRRARIIAADEHDLFSVGIEYPQHQKQVGIAAVRRYEQLGGDRAGDLQLLRQRPRAEGDPVAGRDVGQGCRA